MTMACACNGKGGTQLYTVVTADGSIHRDLNNATAEVLRMRKGGKKTAQPLAKRK